MDTQELIQSGELEAYVCGILSPEESTILTQQIYQSEELELEVKRIETVYMRLAAGVAPELDDIEIYEYLKNYVKENSRHQDKLEWGQYLGWAAALLLFVGAGYLFHQNTNMREAIVGMERSSEILETDLEQTQELNQDYQDAIAFIKSKNTKKIILSGQNDFINSSAVAFHNDELEKTYIDITGLPEAPDDMTYQLWSLTLNPLTPTNIGLLSSVNNRMIEVDNTLDTEAFGITLEKAGGSSTPTMERLYTLGVIE